MDQFVELLKQVNIAQIFIVLAGVWVFYSRLDRKVDKINERIDKLSDKIEDVDRRLCRIEGSMATQGHCLFSHHNKLEKTAE